MRVRFPRPAPRRPFSGRPAALAAFARANGFDYDDSLAGSERELPSLILDGACQDVLRWGHPALVEFGNHGRRFWPGSDDLVPSRQGYIAVRHGLAVPHVLVDFAGVLGAATPLNLASAALTVLSAFDEDRGDPDGSPIARFQHGSEQVDLPEGAGITARCAHGSVEEARALLSADALPILADLARSFAVEIRDEWLFAYSFYGDVSTPDPDVWAWVFSSASRMLDLVQIWEGGVAGSGAGGHWRDVPFYTERRVERPVRLDGVLRFIKRGR